jgi:hypothetical protein
MEKPDLAKMHILTRGCYSQLLISLKKTLRIIGDNSRSTSNFQVSMKGLPETSLNLQAYTLAKQRIHEIETQKAMTISLSRHEKWKAGGPL